MDTTPTHISEGDTLNTVPPSASISSFPSAEGISSVSTLRDPSSISTVTETATSSSSTMSNKSSTSSQGSVDRIVGEVFGPQSSLMPTKDSPKTYKLVMDNIDKTLKPNDMRMDHQTKSLHYVHKYAVLDRLDLSTFDDKPCHPEIDNVHLESMLPTKKDGEKVRQNMAILVARVLIKNFPFLKSFARSLGRHILHLYSNEMSQKSEVVSSILGSSFKM